MQPSTLATAEAQALDDVLAGYAQLDDAEETEALLASPSRALQRSTSVTGGALGAHLGFKRPPMVAYIVMVPVVILIALLVVGAIWEFS
jgi:hypothetical protein